ncbi:condensin-2 complex subunit H2-like [Planoprotostelium fungivorum]|nr:condensin-2 complex subunit H2-like [Planoprotostelium fungivorum]
MDNDGPAPFGDFDSGSADITGGLIVGHGDWSDVPIHTDEASYEEMVRQHVEKYLSSVEGFIRETTLTQRIGDWRKKIFPVLEEQESRPSYDIKIYGRTLLDRCNKEKATKTKSVALQRLVQDVGGEAPAHEVCRYFLALLQLSNDGNIQIVPDKEGSLKRLDVKLINDRQRADVEAYRGPPSTAEDKMMQLSDKENMENMS